MDKKTANQILFCSIRWILNGSKDAPKYEICEDPDDDYKYVCCTHDFYFYDAIKASLEVLGDDLPDWLIGKEYLIEKALKEAEY